MWTYQEESGVNNDCGDWTSKVLSRRILCLFALAVCNSHTQFRSCDSRSLARSSTTHYRWQTFCFYAGNLLNTLNIAKRLTTAPITHSWSCGYQKVQTRPLNTEKTCADSCTLLTWENLTEFSFIKSYIHIFVYRLLISFYFVVDCFILSSIPLNFGSMFLPYYK